MRGLAMILACAMMAGALVGCSGDSNPAADIASAVGGALEGAATAVGNAIGQVLSGDVTGQVGKTYVTQWFSFNIESITFVDEYEGEVPEEGKEFIDVVCTVTGLWESEPVPMLLNDFYVDAAALEDHNVIPWSAWHDSMWPDYFELELDESATYHMIFEVPKGVDDLKLMYTEIDESEEVHATFTIEINR